MNCCRDDICLDEHNKTLRNVFIVVFAINAVMFCVEMIFGTLAHSTSLIADSLDMLGDTFVYGISLYVLTKNQQARNKASFIKGMVMLLLGLNVIRDVVIKTLNPTLPIAEIITIIGAIALLANLLCFYLLQKHKGDEINIRSAWICSRNDVIANISVIGAGFLVGAFNSMWPDILVGLGIALLVLDSSFQIIKESWVKIKVKQ